jgi:DHA1 family bicyclomycin/chloramphenicol resistance-like MFS transporter
VGGIAVTGEDDKPAKQDERLTGARLLLLASLAALGALATNIMLPAFPPIAKDLGVDSRELALTLSVFFVVFAVGQLFVGPLADSLGRKPLVLGGLAVFLAGSIVCAAAPSLEILIAGRAIQAAGACAASVLARAVARDLFNGAELTRALSLVMIAMAAAPGFSPALGTTLDALFGWRSVFVFVAAASALVALHYALSIGETLPPERRRAARPLLTLVSYANLAGDLRFMAPALAVSLVIGCLYSFFAAAPAILMTGMGISATGLSVFFAATVFVVFGSGLLTARLARKFGAAQVGMTGIMMAVASGAWLVAIAGTPTTAPFMAAVTLFLAGMGLVNPIATAIALEPFGDRAGTASALIGFLQMGFAAVGTSLVGSLPLPPASAFACIVAGSSALAAIAFTPALRHAQATRAR